MSKMGVWSPLLVGSAGVRCEVRHCCPALQQLPVFIHSMVWLHFVSQPPHTKSCSDGFCCVSYEDRVSPGYLRTLFEPCYELILQSLEGKLNMLECCCTQMINLDYLLCLLINCASVSFADCRTWHSIIRKGPLQLKAVLKLVPRLRKKLWRKSGSPMKMTLLLWMWVFLGCRLFLGLKPRKDFECEGPLEVTWPSSGFTQRRPHFKVKWGCVGSCLLLNISMDRKPIVSLGSLCPVSLPSWWFFFPPNITPEFSVVASLICLWECGQTFLLFICVCYFNRVFFWFIFEWGNWKLYLDWENYRPHNFFLVARTWRRVCLPCCGLCALACMFF